MKRQTRASMNGSGGSALDLACALKRYARMRPENAYVALAKEWPAPVVALVSDVMWSEVKGRTAKEITHEIMMLMEKARKAHAAVMRAQRRMNATTRRKNHRS